MCIHILDAFTLHLTLASLESPTVKTKSYGQRSFAYQAATFLNKLPLEIKYQGTLDGLKRALKTHLFRFQLALSHVFYLVLS